MAVTTTFELYDVLSASGSDSYEIKATDLQDVVQVVITSDDAKAYLMGKYGTRYFSTLKGAKVDVLESASDLKEKFDIYIRNRQHNIDKQYQAIFDYNYSPIENVDRYETETTQDSRTSTYGKTQTESGTNSTGKSGTEAVAGSGKDTTTHLKSGFNSPSTYTPDEKTELSKGATDTTTYNTTDATTFGHKTTDGGSDSDSGQSSRTLRVHGNIGVTRSDELMMFEIESRKLALAELILDDFINKYTYYA